MIISKNNIINYLRNSRNKSEIKEAETVEIIDKNAIKIEEEKEKQNLDQLKIQINPYSLVFISYLYYFLLNIFNVTKNILLKSERKWFRK